MSFNNPLAAIFQSYVVAGDCLKVARRVLEAPDDRLSPEQKTRLGRNTGFIGNTGAEADQALKGAKDQVTDLAILALFATFERVIIERVQLAKERIDGGQPQGYFGLLSKKFDDAVEYWRFEDILDLFENEVDGKTRGDVKQIKGYRDWIAHRNPKKTPANITPEQAFATLTRVLETIDSAHAPHTPPAAPAQLRR
ncbi:hypothetical protein [Burkholderia glumae]|uniref:hypothetical protein n=1 Tax=Burkholderia glumae TaxID=337 RepID=UPI002150BF9B|nr:hypothetical protein [Burkholderia glumae]